MKKLFIFSLILISLFSSLLHANEFTDNRGRYLIIVHDIFYNSILPLAEWKHQKGMEVDIAKISEIGGSTGDIKSYIVDAYNNWEVPPEFVLLVGDTEYINCYNSYDSYYADVEGDFHEDICVGRLTVDSAGDCDLMVSRILNYERYPYMEDTSMYTRACLMCNDNDYSPDEYIFDTEYITALMEEDGYTDVHDLRHSTGDNQQTVLNLIEEGITFLNYRGPGGGGWQYPFDVDPNQSNPDGKYPVVVSATCATGEIEGDFAEGELWMRAGNLQMPRGALAYYSTNTWHESQQPITILRGVIDRAFYDAIFTNGEHQLGKACVYAKDVMIEQYPLEMIEYTGWILQGDPELNMFTAVPRNVTVDAMPIIPAGMTEFYVNCSVGEQPIENALVCLYKEGDVYATGYTDSNGDVWIQTDPIPPLPIETVKLTVTGRNLHPYETDLTIVTGEAIEGYISDVDDGTPIKAKVNLESMPIYAVAGIDDGFYRIYLPEPGDYNFTASYWGYQDFMSQTITVAEDDTVDFDFQMIPQIDAGSVDGTVKAYDESPLADAKVTLLGVPMEPTYTDENGYYKFWPLTSDYDYEMEVSHQSFEPQTQVFSLDIYEEENIDFLMAYIETYENSDGWFVAEGMLNNWEWGTPTLTGGPEFPYSGTKCWGTNLDGPYGRNRNMYMYSPIYSLNFSLTPSLVFYTWYETNLGWDGGNVNISIDSGETWEIIHPDCGYPDESIIGLTGKPGFTGFSDGWVRQEFDLTPYVGEDAQFALRFASTNTEARGWFIDNFTVNGGILALATPENFGAQVVNEDDVNLSWEAPNTDVLYQGFSLYRKTQSEEFFGESIASLDSLTISFTDMNLESGNYVYGLSTVYNNGLESSKVTIDVHVIGSGIEIGENLAIPKQYSLAPNYPNPFNPTTTIKFELPEKAPVNLSIYEVSGKLVKTLVSDEVEAGYHSVMWNGKDDSGKDVPSGLYLYKIEGVNYRQTRQCLLLK